MNRLHREINVPTMPRLIIVLSNIVRRLDLKMCDVVSHVSIVTVLLDEYFDNRIGNASQYTRTFRQSRTRNLLDEPL